MQREEHAMTVINVPAGQTLSNFTVDFDDILNVRGTVIDTTIIFGTENVFGGGEAISTTVSGFGFEEILNGGTASGTIIRGGEQVVDGGGTASGTIISSDGALNGEQFIDGGT